MNRRERAAFDAEQNYLRVERAWDGFCRLHVRCRNCSNFARGRCAIPDASVRDRVDPDDHCLEFSFRSDDLKKQNGRLEEAWYQAWRGALRHEDPALFAEVFPEEAATGPSNEAGRSRAREAAERGGPEAEAEAEDVKLWPSPP